MLFSLGPLDSLGFEFSSTSLIIIVFDNENYGLLLLPFCCLFIEPVVLLEIVFDVFRGEFIFSYEV